jgi:manganese/zinc/iron transport system ATP- binding protein
MFRTFITKKKGGVVVKRQWWRASEPQGSREHHRGIQGASPPLSVHSLTVAYNNRPVIWDIEYTASSGNLIAIVGPNGAGKSTFIKACLGLIPVVTGSIEFWGRTLRQERHRIGYVPQRESVDWEFPVSALDVVTMGRYGRIGWLKPIRASDRQAALGFLRAVDLEAFADRQISQLSGGQQQRVFLARALAQEADLYFMDEPFAGVDAATERAIIDLFRLLKEQGKTVISVHHDLTTIPEYFDSVMMVNMHLIASGGVGEVFTQENLRKTFGGRQVVLDQVTHALGQREG